MFEPPPDPDDWCEDTKPERTLPCSETAAFLTEIRELERKNEALIEQVRALRNLLWENGIEVNDGCSNSKP